MNDTTVYRADQYANNHPAGIEHFYWHRARNRILLRKLRPSLAKDDLIFDVGCGPGVVVDYLRKHGFECRGSDLGNPTFVVPGAREHVYLGQDAFALDESIRRRVTVLLLMDVLEHLPTPEHFLAECANAFPGTRCVYITLPARPEIWSNYDEYYGHYRRYTLESLRDVRLPSDFRIAESGYFFHSLYWAARAMRPFSRERSFVLSAPRVRSLHDAVGAALALEERIVPTTHPGSSLYAILRRHPSRSAPAEPTRRAR